MDETEIKYFIEAALLAAGRPLSIDQLKSLFDDEAAPEKAQIREALQSLADEYKPRGIAIGEVASGFRMQLKSTMAERLSRLWEERPPRYSRALFETLALIAYRQPMTRGEIEEIRGVAVSSNIVRSLLEREWVRVVGHRDVPGRPAMFGTTRQFLDYFGLKKLEDLPPLADLSDWETLRVQLNLPAVSEDDTYVDTADIRALPVGEAEEDELTGSPDDAGEGADVADEEEAMPAVRTAVHTVEDDEVAEQSVADDQDAMPAGHTAPGTVENDDAAEQSAADDEDAIQAEHTVIDIVEDDEATGQPAADVKSRQGTVSNTDDDTEMERSDVAAGKR
jgi:segregation and condensation protein B